MLSAFITSCTVSRPYHPGKKFSAGTLSADFHLLREILEQKHPSLYWYTPKDSMDFYFEQSANRIKDSMTAHNFGWQVVAPLLANIHCGHTSLSGGRRARNIPARGPDMLMPLYLKVWKDSMLVVANLNEDTLITPGSYITHIDNRPAQQIIDSMFQYLPEDGYSDNIKYIRLSASFPFLYRNIFGPLPFYNLQWIDTTGHTRQSMISCRIPKTDSVNEKSSDSKKRIPRSERRRQIRDFLTDTSYAIMDLNAFSKGSLRPFFRRTFRRLRKDQTQNLIIDLRINGGGDMNKAVMLARYIRDTPFHVADSAYSISKNFNPYSAHITNSFWNNLALLFASKKHADGKYHFGYWERKRFRPKKKNHFDGQVYILTNGLTFSAASLFCSLVKGQENVMLVGEETGGGWYGNSGILIPDIILPETGLKVRLPFFRLVQYQHDPVRKGMGVTPDWYIWPDARDILQGRDTKMEAVLQRIQKKGD